MAENETNCSIISITLRRYLLWISRELLWHRRDRHLPNLPNQLDPQDMVGPVTQTLFHHRLNPQLFMKATMLRQQYYVLPENESLQQKLPENVRPLNRTASAGTKEAFPWPRTGSCLARVRPRFFPVLRRALFCAALSIGLAAEYVGNAQGLETASLVVTTTDDVVNNADGFTSLREAINFAHSDGVNSAITFAVSGTIRLTSALPALANNGSLSISNHQSGIVTISGDANGSGINDAGDVRIFSVNSGANVALHRLMLSGGRAVDGGAIHNNGGTVVVTDSTFTRHVASNYGGALFNTNGTLTVIRSTLATNSAFYGGAIFNVTTNIAAG